MGEKLSVLFFLGETVLIVLTICNNLTLTDQNDKSIIHFDNESCQVLPVGSGLFLFLFLGFTMKVVK